MDCQNCSNNDATVHVTELQEEAGDPKVHERHLCDECAQKLGLPHVPVALKKTLDIWKLLNLTKQQTRRKPSPTCPECGMTLDEFRKRGRMGCAKDYDVFGPHLAELLERVHGATRHVGRVPGRSEEELDQLQRVDALKAQLEDAIRDEAYESAARIRDELKQLEDGGGV